MLNLTKPLQGTYVMNVLKEFNKPMLMECTQSLRSLLVVAHEEYTPESDARMTAICDTIISEGVHSFKKDDLVSFLASFAQDMNNIAEISKFGVGWKDVWHDLIVNPSLSYGEINDRLKRKLTVNIEKKSYYRITCQTDALLLPARIESTSYYSYYSWSLNRENLNHLSFLLGKNERIAAARAFLGPQSVEMKLTGDLPADLKLQTVTYESDIAKNLYYLSGLAISGSLLTSTGMVTPARANSIARKMEMRGFEFEKTIYPLDRALLVMMTYASLVKRNENLKNKVDGNSAGAFARFIINNKPGLFATTDFQAFLPGLKSFTKTWTVYGNEKVVINQINQMLTRTGGEWLDMSNFRLLYLCEGTSDGPNGYLCLFGSEGRSRSTLKRQGESVRDYTNPNHEIDWWDEVTWPFVVHYLKYLCGCGLLELAINEEDSRDELEGVKYVRLTPLGRYGLGLDRKYVQADVQDSAVKFDVDDDNQIITVLERNSPYLAYMSQIGQSIGGQRFRITPESIVRGSKTAEQLDKNLSTFQHLIMPEPNEFWQNLLEEARNRKDVTRSDDAYYMLVMLNPAIPGLIRAVSEDRELARHSLKVEKAGLLIEREYWDKFKEDMLDRGYMF